MDKVTCIIKAIYQFLDDNGEYPALIKMHPNSFLDIVTENGTIFDYSEIDINQEKFIMGIKVEVDPFISEGLFYLYN